MSKFKLGTFRATSLVAGNMIGSGALLAPALLAPYGKMSLIGWILTTIGALSLALIFGKLSTWITQSGGPFTFARHVFGDYVGFQMACSYWFSAIFGSVSLVGGTLQYVSIFYPGITESALISILFGSALIWLFTITNLYGFKVASTAEVIILGIKILPLVIIAFVGLFFVDFSKITDFSDIKNQDLCASLSAMSGVLLWSFLGLESITIPSDKIKNPKTTIPLSIVLGVLLVAAVYIFGTIVITGVLPYDQLVASKAPYVDAGGKIFGSVGTIFMMVTGIIGIAGSLNGWILIQGQVPLAAAQEGIFPKFFASSNKYGTPYGVVIGSIIMTAAFLFSYQPSLLKHVELMIDVAVFATVVPYFYCLIAFVYLSICQKKSLSKVEKLTIPLISTIALLYTILAVLGMGQQIAFLWFILFLITSPFYCFIKKRKIG